MHTLIVTAHPSSKGFTHEIAAAYARGRTTQGHTVEILDLYKTDLKQGFLTFENFREYDHDVETRKVIQQKLMDAGEVVFIHPLWWMGPPAILKNFLDNNLTARFAFRYIDGKLVGLMKGRDARVFITCDGNFWLYFMMALPFWSIWYFAILRYCGFNVKSLKVLDKKMKRSREYLDKYLVMVEKIGAGK